MKLSLVLATYGRADEFCRCLESLYAQEDCNFEVLVMDQNPDDRLVDAIMKFQKMGLAVRHERLPKPGLSEARNAGLRIATGDIIGFPDDDCWYETQTVARIRQSFEESSMLSGVVADWVEQTRGGGNAHSNSASLLSLNSWRDFRGGAASSITLFLKRDLLISLNGFDNRLGVGQWYGAGEETDLVLRALEAGAQIKRSMQAKVHHAYVAANKSDTQVKPGTARARARGTGAIYAKHRLSLTTIARGLAAPILRALLRLQFGQSLQLAWDTSLGRFEGMRQWKKEESAHK
jgi:glycosyltransferase involved in cell wall biosynthesis